MLTSLVALRTRTVHCKEYKSLRPMERPRRSRLRPDYRVSVVSRKRCQIKFGIYGRAQTRSVTADLRLANRGRGYGDRRSFHPRPPILFAPRQSAENHRPPEAVSSSASALPLQFCDIQHSSLRARWSTARLQLQSPRKCSTQAPHACGMLYFLSNIRS